MSIAELSMDNRIWYEKAGRGPGLLHIHGSAYGHRNFERLTPLMRANFEVVDFDFPGYGESPRLASSTAGDIETLADLVADLIAALGYAKMHVHGTSFGGMVALALAARHPDRVDKLVLSCFLARYDAAARVMRATWKRAARDSGMDAVADLTAVAGFSRQYFERAEAPAQLESMREAFLKNEPAAFIASTEVLERTDLAPLLSRVRAPTLLLAGDEDNMTPFKTGSSGFGMAQAREELPSSELVVLRECGHYLVIEQPEEAARHATRFLLGFA